MTPTLAMWIAAFVVLTCCLAFGFALRRIRPRVYAPPLGTVGIEPGPDFEAPVMALDSLPADDGKPRWDMTRWDITQDGWITPHVPQVPADDLAVRSESTNPNCTHPKRPEPVEVDLGDGPTTIGHLCPDCFGTVGVCLACWEAEHPRTIRTADDARALLDAQTHRADHLADGFEAVDGAFIGSADQFAAYRAAVEHARTLQSLITAITAAEKSGSAS